jgi:hypothetical protein
MEFFTSEVIWLLIAYTLGTVIGLKWGYKKGVFDASERAIDALISQGIIRTSTDANGETQIHKWND